MYFYPSGRTSLALRCSCCVFGEGWRRWEGLAAGSVQREGGEGWMLGCRAEGSDQREGVRTKQAHLLQRWS